VKQSHLARADQRSNSTPTLVSIIPVISSLVTGRIYTLIDSRYAMRSEEDKLGGSNSGLGDGDERNEMSLSLSPSPLFTALASQSEAWGVHRASGSGLEVEGVPPLSDPIPSLLLSLSIGLNLPLPTPPPPPPPDTARAGYAHAHVLPSQPSTFCFTVMLSISLRFAGAKSEWVRLTAVDGSVTVVISKATAVP